MTEDKEKAEELSLGEMFEKMLYIDPFLKMAAFSLNDVMEDSSGALENLVKGLNQEGDS